MQNTFQKITTSLDSLHVRKQIGAHGNVPNNISPHVDAEMNSIPTLVNKVRIIPAERWPLGTLNALLRFVMCERSSSVTCWCNHSLNTKFGGISSANRRAFREKSNGCDRSSWKKHRWSSDATVPILIRYRQRYYTALVSQLQLWHIQ